MPVYAGLLCTNVVAQCAFYLFFEAITGTSLHGTPMLYTVWHAIPAILSGTMKEYYIYSERTWVVFTAGPAAAAHDVRRLVGPPAPGTDELKANIWGNAIINKT